MKNFYPKEEYEKYPLLDEQIYAEARIATALKGWQHLKRCTVDGAGIEWVKGDKTWYVPGIKCGDLTAQEGLRETYRNIQDALAEAHNAIGVMLKSEELNKYPQHQKGVK